MDLWIRSQDKAIITKTENLEIETEVYDEVRIISDMYHTVGMYKTKERALEVLNEIQNALLNKWANNVIYEEHYDNERPRIMIYEMPKE